MPAVVRVKRRIDEEPLSAFVLNCHKRRRLDDNEANKDELSTLLKFAGTINEQDDSATTQFARLTKEEAKELVLRKTRKPINATEKARQEMRKNLQEQRFRVVNCLRTTLDANENDANEKSKEITIVDIEKHTANDKTVETQPTLLPLSTSQLSSGVGGTTRKVEEASTSAAAAAAAAVVTSSSTPTLTMPSDSDTGYVYDLYIPDSEQHADYVDLLDENYLSVRPFDDLIYEDRYNNDDDNEYDSEDSNQENYFGNEYPDEDDDKAMNSDRDDEEDEDEDDDARHLAKGLDKFVFGDDDEDEGNDGELMASSSDDDDNYCNAYRDPYVHTIDPEEQKFCEDVDSCDVDRYGLAYARYKARILKKSKPKKGDDDGDDEEDDDEDGSTKSNYGDTSDSSCDYDDYYDSVTGDYH